MSNPTPATMTTTTRKKVYNLTRLDLPSLNRFLIDIGARLDSAEAIGQNPNGHGKTIKNLGPGIKSTDSIQFNQSTRPSILAGQMDMVLAEGSAITLTYNEAAGTITLAVKRKAGYGIDADADGLKLKQQAAISDASAISAITLDTGADHVDRAGFNTKLGTLQAEIDAIKDTLNDVIHALEALEGIAT